MLHVARIDLRALKNHLLVTGEIQVKLIVYLICRGDTLLINNHFLYLRIFGHSNTLLGLMYHVHCQGFFQRHHTGRLLDQVVAQGLTQLEDVIFLVEVRLGQIFRLVLTAKQTENRIEFKHLVNFNLLSNFAGLVFVLVLFVQFKADFSASLFLKRLSDVRLLGLHGHGECTRSPGDCLFGVGLIKVLLFNLHLIFQRNISCQNLLFPQDTLDSY